MLSLKPGRCQPKRSAVRPPSFSGARMGSRELGFVEGVALAVPVTFQYEKPPEEESEEEEEEEEEMVEKEWLRRVALEIPRGFVAPVVSSWPWLSWRMKRTFEEDEGLSVTFEKERVRAPVDWEAFPRYEPMK